VGSILKHHHINVQIGMRKTSDRKPVAAKLRSHTTLADGAENDDGADGK